MYRQFKVTLEYETYLNEVPRSLRYYFCRLRMSANPLLIQTGRHINKHRNERYCSYCLNNNTFDIEDEYHFVCICPCFPDLRKKYINKKYRIRPSVFKYIQLLKSVNRTELIKLSSFINEALGERSAFYNSIV